MVNILRRLNKSTNKRQRKSACERIMEQLDTVVDYDDFLIAPDVDSMSIEMLMDDRYRLWCPVKLSMSLKKGGQEKLTKKPINRLKMMVPHTMKWMPDGSYIHSDLRYKEVGMTSHPKARWKYSEAVAFCRNYPKLAKMPSKRNPPKILEYPCGSPMLGIVLPVGRSGLVIWDVDGCFDAQGNLDPAVEKWIKSIRGYIEKSPSGRGLRGIFLAELPFARAALEHPDGFTVEVFSHGPNAWATFTDNAISQDRKIYRQPVLEEELCDLYVAQQAKKQIEAEAKKAQALAEKKAKLSNPAIYQTSAAVLASAPLRTMPTAQPVSGISVGMMGSEDSALLERIMKSHQGAKFSEIWAGDKAGFQQYGYYRAQAVYWLLQSILWWSSGNVARSVGIVINAPIVRNSVSGKLRSPDHLTKMAIKIRSTMTHFRRQPRILIQRIFDLLQKKGEVTLGTLRKYVVRKDGYGVTDDQLSATLDTLIQGRSIIQYPKATKHRKKPVIMYRLEESVSASCQIWHQFFDSIF